MAEADAGVLTRGWLALIGASAGFLFILSPPAGLAAILSLALFHLLRAPLRQWWIAPSCAAAVAGMLAVPWAVRNMHELGAPIFLRDNFGLELAIANYPGAVHPADPRLAYWTRLTQIQTMHLTGAELRAAGGEVGYYRALGQTTREWIAAHPWDFLALCGRRFVEFFLPPRWFWSPYSAAPDRYAGLRQFIVWLAALGGLATLVGDRAFSAALRLYTGGRRGLLVALCPGASRSALSLSDFHPAHFLRSGWLLAAFHVFAPAAGRSKSQPFPAGFSWKVGLTFVYFNLTFLWSAVGPNTKERR